jgi:predicted lipoprotein with Yx(FWY)xxD motif
MMSFKRLFTGSIAVAVLVAACSSSATPAPTAAPVDTTAPTTAPVDTTAPTTAPVTGSATVLAQSIGGQMVLVAGSNGMTVYTFTNDTANSGKSACGTGCIAKWPALTVAAGAAPTAGDGVTGKLDVIKRDDGTMQVTYNGLPLYFYFGDKAPGDTNGNYPGWNLVKP